MRQIARLLILCCLLNTSSVLALTESIGIANETYKYDKAYPTCINLRYNQAFRTKDINVAGETTKLQNFYVELGYLEMEPTGFYGRFTEQATRRLQYDWQLDINGVIDTNTRELIYAMTCNPSDAQASQVGTIINNNYSGSSANTIYSNSNSSFRPTNVVNQFELISDMDLNPGDVITYSGKSYKVKAINLTDDAVLIDTTPITTSSSGSKTNTSVSTKTSTTKTQTLSSTNSNNKTITNKTITSTTTVAMNNASGEFKSSTSSTSYSKATTSILRSQSTSTIATNATSQVKAVNTNAVYNQSTALVGNNNRGAVTATYVTDQVNQGQGVIIGTMRSQLTGSLTNTNTLQSNLNRYTNMYPQVTGIINTGATGQIIGTIQNGTTNQVVGTQVSGSQSQTVGTQVTGSQSQSRGAIIPGTQGQTRATVQTGSRNQTQSEGVTTYRSQNSNYIIQGFNPEDADQVSNVIR